jgi:cytochrome P450
MVTAGSETVAQGSMALFRQLASDQMLQTRLREEVKEAFGGDVEEMDAYTLGKLPYLDAVVQETLRLVPPVPAGKLVDARDGNDGLR